MKSSALPVVVLALCGCDGLFGLVRVPPVDGDAGPVDAPGSDAYDADIDAPDAKPCTPVGHNEDTDNYDDGCDSCPTVANVGVDSDGDGLDDACDPNLGTNNGDKIVFYTAFATADALTSDFTSNGTVSWEAGTKGQVAVLASSVLTSRNIYAPTAIVVRTAQVGQGIGAEVNVMHSGATCQVRGSDCAKTSTTATCLIAYPNGGQGELGSASPNVRSITMQGADEVTCKVSIDPNGLNPASADAPASLATSNLQFTTSSSGAILIESIVIYGTL